MGNDGGSIPTRRELVKEKKKKEVIDKNVELAARWLLCALTQVQLRLPIVACEMGMFYNKESVLEFLLDRSKFSDKVDRFSHLKSLKDVHELKLTRNPLTNENSASSSNESDYKYICPISQLQMNGKYKFLYPVSCGCVFSDRAFRELLPTVKSEPYELPCLVCGKTFNYIDDVVILNPEAGSEQEDARKQMERRKTAAKLAKKKAKSDSKKDSGKKRIEKAALVSDLMSKRSKMSVPVSKLSNKVSA